MVVWFASINSSIGICGQFGLGFCDYSGKKALSIKVYTFQIHC